MPHSSDDDSDRRSSSKNFFKKHNFQLDTTNWDSFDKKLKSDCRNFRQVGKSIMRGYDERPTRPSPNDLLNPDDPLDFTFRFEHLLFATEQPAIGAPATPPYLVPNAPNQPFHLANNANATITIANDQGVLVTFTVSHILSVAGNLKYEAVMETYDKLVDTTYTWSNKIITYIITGITPETLSTLELNQTYNDARDDGHSYLFYSTIKNTLAFSKNGKVIQHRTLNGFQLKQLTTHRAYAHQVLDFEKVFQSDFGGKTKIPAGVIPIHYEGYVRIRDVVEVIYQGGLSVDEFGQRLEVFYSSNPATTLGGISLEDTITANNNYLDTKLVTTTTQPVEPGSTLATFKSYSNATNSKYPSTPHRPTNPTQPPNRFPTPIFNSDRTKTQCVNCKTFFPTLKQKNHDDRYHVRCNNCFLEHIKKVKTSKEANRPPTPPKNPKKSVTIDPKSVSAAKALLSRFAAMNDSDGDYEDTSSLHTHYSPPILTTDDDDDDDDPSNAFTPQLLIVPDESPYTIDTSILFAQHFTPSTDSIVTTKTLNRPRNLTTPNRPYRTPPNPYTYNYYQLRHDALLIATKLTQSQDAIDRWTHRFNTRTNPSDPNDNLHYLTQLFTHKPPALPFLYPPGYYPLGWTPHLF
jgi:hypothetical protein